MDLKIKDVADLLNVSETTIRRWLSDRKIPAYKINHQYRFNRYEIENWVMSQKLGTTTGAAPFNSKQESTEDTADEVAVPGGRKQFSLFRAIHKGGVFHNVPGKTKEEVIRNVMKEIAKDLNVDREMITELLLDREKLQSTALNHGIAIPHTRDCVLTAGQNVIAVVFPEHPIPYDALDGKPVHTLFFLFTCEDKRHLHLLAKIAHLTSQEAPMKFLQKKPSKQEFLEFIKDWESSIQKVENN